MAIKLSSKVGIEPITVEYGDGDKTVEVDIVRLAERLQKVYEDTKDDTNVATTDALNAVYVDIGLNALDVHAADALACAVCDRGRELKNSLWAPRSGTAEPVSLDSSLSTPGS